MLATALDSDASPRLDAGAYAAEWKWNGVRVQIVGALWDDLANIRAGVCDAGIESIVLKRRDSLYVAGRPKGLWFKSKRDPLVADCVLKYGQRIHSKRSSFYSDGTFGCWRRAARTRQSWSPWTRRTMASPMQS